MLTEKQFQKILEKTKRLCSNSEKCLFDVRQYLNRQKQDNISEQEKEQILETLVEENYINEIRYVEFFVNDKLKLNKWGKIKIRYSLKQKNIDDKTIDLALNKVDNQAYIEILNNIINQKYNTLKNKSEIQAKAALIRFCTGRGFEYNEMIDIINSVCKIK